MSETLTIGNVQVLVRRSHRRRTIELTIERDGSVIAAAPAATDLVDVLRVVRSREVWIHSALLRRDSVKANSISKDYVSGEGFYYLGRTYRLIVNRRAAAESNLPELRLFQSRFQLRGDCVSRGRECFTRWYTQKADEWLGERMPR